MANHYAARIVPVLLSGCQNPATEVQVTCLSILADALPLIAQQLTSFQYEVGETLRLKII